MRGINRHKKTKWFRYCPSCNDKVYHKTKEILRVGIYKNKMCWECKCKKQKETFLGEKNPMYGKTHTPEVKEVLRNLQLGKTLSPESIMKSLKNVIRTKEWKKHISESLSGEKSYRYGMRYSEEEKLEMSKKRKGKYTGKDNPFYGKTHTPEVKENLRVGCLNRIKLTGVFPAFNKNACKFFTILNDKFGWDGKHALNGGETEISGYSVDYFNPKLNLIIEWDEERYHYRNGKLLEKDIIRQNNILKKDNYHFYRIREKTGEILKVDSLKENHTELIQELLNENKK